MSSLMDDYDAQERMLQQAHADLAKKDPKNPWLYYFEPGTKNFRTPSAVEALGIEQACNASPHPVLYAMAMYTQRLGIELRSMR